MDKFKDIGIIIKLNIKKILVLLLAVSCLVLLFFVCKMFVFTEKISDDEYVIINEMYSEMCRVESDLKPMQYYNEKIKKLDKQYVSDELIKDTYLYCVSVVNRGFEMFEQDYDSVSVYRYFARCNLDFTRIKALDFADNVFILSEAYFRSFQDDEEVLGQYAVYLDGILSPVSEEIVKIEQERVSEKKTALIWYIVIMLLSFSSFVGIKYYRVEKGRKNKKEIK